MRAELGVDGVVAALLAADRVRRAGVVGAGGERVVAALARLDADRVDGREVEDVEAELGDRGDLLLDRLEAAPRAREELVPGGEGGGDAVDLDDLRGVELARAGALGGALHGGEQVGGERGVGRRLRVLEHGERRLDRLLVGALGARRGLLEQHDALGQLAGEVLLPGGDLALQLVAPGGEDVAPGLDRPLPAAHHVDRELALPAHAVDVRVDRPHRRLDPAAAAGAAVAHDGAEDLVAVAEDVGGHADGLADHALGGIAPGVDRGRRVLDDDARRVALGVGYRH